MEQPLSIDPGAARRISEKSRKKLNWVFTQEFAAPELLQRRRTLMGPWTDAYGLGATIFACLCSYSPQSAEERAVEDRLPQSFRVLRRMYSGDLLDPLEWCLHLEPGQRPQTMAKLQERLLACQLTHPPRPRQKFTRHLSKRVRRKMKLAPKVAKYS